MMSLSECVAALAELIQQNRTIEAMERFYADDVIMQENDQAPRVGKFVCLNHERNLLTLASDLKATLQRQAINEQTGVVFSEWYLTVTYWSGKQFSYKEISVQQWHNGQVFNEKFYYDTNIKVTAALTLSAQ